MKQITSNVMTHKRALQIAFISLVFIFLIVITVRSNAFSGGHPKTNREKIYISITIKPGDTLWSIAERYTSEEYTSINDYVKELKTLNKIGYGGAIRAGEKLLAFYYAD